MKGIFKENTKKCDMESRVFCWGGDQSSPNTYMYIVSLSCVYSVFSCMYRPKVNFIC